MQGRVIELIAQTRQRHVSCLRHGPHRRGCRYRLPASAGRATGAVWRACCCPSPAPATGFAQKRLRIVHQLNVSVAAWRSMASFSASIPRARVETSGTTGQPQTRGEGVDVDTQLCFSAMSSMLSATMQGSPAQATAASDRVTLGLDASTTLINRSASPLRYSDRQSAHRARFVTKWWLGVGAGQIHQRDLIVCRGELAFFTFNRYARPVTHTLACTGEAG